MYDSAKRSQFLEVLVLFYLIDRQRIGWLTAPFCHLASFCRNWLRFGVWCSPTYDIRWSDMRWWGAVSPGGHEKEVKKNACRNPLLW
jgi:hypothetical protein